MKIVYNKLTGNILSMIPDDQEPRSYSHTPKEHIRILKLDSYPNYNIKYYRVVDGCLVRRGEKEIDEIVKYGRVLTEEERLNIKLQPSPKEISKAETTLEILSTLQEVGII